MLYLVAARSFIDLLAPSFSFLNYRMSRDLKTAAGKGPSSEEQEEFRNKEKTLVLCTRGVTFRYRHLMMDMCQLMPHCKKESKLDTKSDRGIINEVADMKGCTSAMFFEVGIWKNRF